MRLQPESGTRVEGVPRSSTSRGNWTPGPRPEGSLRRAMSTPSWFDRRALRVLLTMRAMGQSMSLAATDRVPGAGGRSSLRAGPEAAYRSGIQREDGRGSSGKKRQRNAQARRARAASLSARAEDAKGLPASLRVFAPVSWARLHGGLDPGQSCGGHIPRSFRLTRSIRGGRFSAIPRSCYPSMPRLRPKREGPG